MLSHIIFIFFIIFSGSNLFAETLCSRFITPDSIEWTTTEKRTLCGSAAAPSWQNIPFNQAEFFFRSFLQSRGYHNPTFEKRDEKLYVKPGKLTLIARIRAFPDRADLALDNYWLPIGQTLTPDELNKIEKWFLFRLGRLGYPCPKLSLTADKETGEVLVQFETGEHWTIDEIKGVSIPDIEDGTLDRYRAFDIGDAYDPVLLEISTNRMKASQTVINIQYSPECYTKPSGTLRQTTLPGEPRLVELGFGFDSENLFIAKGTWRNSRLSRQASILDVSGSLSYRKQMFLTAYDYYYLKEPSSHYLKSYLKLERNFEANFESRSIKSLTAPAYGVDTDSLRWEMYAGPSLQFEFTKRGDAPAETRLLTLDLSLSVQSHSYEYYLANPQEGFQANIFGSFSNKSISSDVSVANYKTSFTYLWNLWNYDPTIWVLGLRGSMATSQPGKGTDATQLPPSFKQFLGGSADLRGFARLNLPSEGTGALTKAYLGLELRLDNQLPLNFQPLVFYDYGRLSDTAFRIDEEKFLSSGLGIRWQSPFGTVRASIAKGTVEDDKRGRYQDRTGIQYYASLGEQF